jgi:uncharacterized protein (UPF0333 family)
MLNDKMKNKRGDISKTITWVVATIIIVGVLILSFYISSVMSNVKVIRESDVTSDLTLESQVLSTKTSLAFKINNINREMIDKALEENNEK